MGAKMEAKLEAIAFERESDLTMPELIELADKVGAHVSTIMTKVRRVETDDTELRYELRQLLGSCGTFIVGRTETDGRASVSFRVVDWIEVRSTLFFIPIGPASSVAYDLGKQFSRIMQDALAKQAPQAA